MLPRVPRPIDTWILVAGSLGLAWLGMMAAHELGHVLGAWATGGTVRRVVVPAFGFSRTDVQPNPSPGVTVWAGPIAGVLVPLGVWAAARWGLGRRWQAPLRFFAGFCLVANGAYLSLGTFDRIGDVGVMLDTGTPAWALWALGGGTVPAGFWLWHGLGPRFGLAQAPSRLTAWLTLGMWLLFCVTFYAITGA